MSDEIFFTVPQLAKELGITPRAIRFYESKNLLTPARAGSTRVYTKKDRARLILILRGKRLGFSLAEISDFLELYEKSSTQEKQLKLLIKKVRLRISDLEEQRRELDRVLNELKDIEIESLEKLGPEHTQEVAS
jgi:DNA-binding transcriptional MerR regulator